MKKIAILTCLNSIKSVCTSAACMKAFNTKAGGFEQYGDEELELVAFFQCNGCGKSQMDDPGIQEKLERILQMKPDAIHLGVCTIRRSGERCKTIKNFVNFFLDHDIKVIDGTHPSKTIQEIGVCVEKYPLEENNSTFSGYTLTP